MKKLFLFAACLAAPAAAAQAQDMPVAEFLQRSDALGERGSGPSTPEYQRLQGELIESARLARNERRIARSQNRAPQACLRAGVRATTNSELFAHLRSIPAAEAQSMTVRQAYMQLMERKFPCRN